MSNYILETYDEFATRRNNEDINNFNDGYEQALVDILEMIEEDASYEELYESISEYLDEGNQDIANPNYKQNKNDFPSANLLKRRLPNIDKYTKKVASQRMQKKDGLNKKDSNFLAGNYVKNNNPRINTDKSKVISNVGTMIKRQENDEKKTWLEAHRRANWKDPRWRTFYGK